MATTSKKVAVFGRSTETPELRTNEEGVAYCCFTLNSAEGLEAVIAWDTEGSPLGRIGAQFVKAGENVLVEGERQVVAYKVAGKPTRMELVASSLQLLYSPTIDATPRSAE